MAYKLKYLTLPTEDFHGITHMCTASKVVGIKTENKTMPAKQGKHKWSLLIKNKYGCQMSYPKAYDNLPKAIL